MTDVIYELDIDLDVVNHLAKPDSVAKFQAEQIRGDLIRDPDAKKVFLWQLQHVRDYGTPATASVLEDQFPDIAIEEPECAVNDLIIRLRTRYLKNEGRRAIESISTLAVEDPLAVAKEMSREARRLLDLTVQRGDVYGHGDYSRAEMEYHKQVARGKGPSLGYDELDDHFHGQLGMTFCIAAPKTYKSWFTINNLIANIEKSFVPYLYALELPALETYWRAVCMAADIPYWKYLKKVLMPDELNRVNAAASAMDDLGSHWKIDKPNQGQRSVAQLVEKAGDAGADCILIDQLQYVENRKGNSIGAMNSTADYFEVVNDLRNYSDEIPIFVVHQFNRSVMKADSMPEMQQAKGSSAIEEVATLALGLWANKDMRHSNVVELGTLASRNYNLQSWELQVQLSRGCEIKMLGPKEDDEL